MSVPPPVSAASSSMAIATVEASSGTAPIDQPTCGRVGVAVRCHAASAIATNAAGHRLSSQAPAS